MTDDQRPMSEKIESVRKIIAAKAAAAPMPPDPDPETVIRQETELVRVRMNRWRAEIPNRFMWAELAHLDGNPVLPELNEWASNPHGRNLILFGPVGSGKTHAAVAAVRPTVLDLGLKVWFRPIIELLDSIRPGADADTFSDLCDIDRLIIDDLGTERSTDWTGERLAAVINRRWLEQIPTIVTTNLAPGKLEEHVGAATFSRLVGSGAVVLMLSDVDRRRA